MIPLGGRSMVRAARLLAIRDLLRLDGLGTREMAQHFGVSQRTIQDDLRLLGASRGIKLVHVWRVKICA